MKINKKSNNNNTESLRNNYEITESKLTNRIQVGSIQFKKNTDCEF